jgi:hypothetical protein
MRTSTRNSRCDAASIKSCAVNHGVSERAVRSWRLNDDPRWRAWLAKSARAGEQLECFSDAANIPSDPSTEAEAARVRFALLSRLVDQATTRGEVAGLPVLLKSAQECQRLLAGCRDAENAWLVQRRELIPRSDFMEIKTRYLEPLMTVLKAQPSEVAAECNPDDPEKAAEALRDWLQTRFKRHFKDAVAGVDRALEETPEHE